MIDPSADARTAFGDDSKPQDIVRVLRLVEYVGPRRWVEDVVARAVHGTHYFHHSGYIRATTLGEFPEIMETESARFQEHQQELQRRREELMALASMPPMIMKDPGPNE